jgi:uncharacterized protein
MAEQAPGQPLEPTPGLEPRSEPARSKKGSWLLAAWPGMGSVAVMSAGYLIQKLGMKPAGQIQPRGHFDIQQIEVRNGIVTPPRLPRTLLYEWTNPGQGPDLFVLVAEAQPSYGAHAFANSLLDEAARRGVGRVVTFASLASQLHPTQEPRVFAASTNSQDVKDLSDMGLPALKEGQIGGLNGLLIGAAAARKMPGVCLLGQIPFFAAGMPNPKTAKALLEAFSLLAKLDLDYAELEEHAAAMEQAMVQMLERMQEAAGREQEDEDEFAVHDDEDLDAGEDDQPSIDDATRARIERLFEQASRDRNKAFRLKQELDRLGVFKEYEDRFLDLFKQAD